jgi:hypothetical protein
MQKEHEMNITQERYQALVDAAQRAADHYRQIAGERNPEAPASTRYYLEGKARGLELALEIIEAPSVTGQALKVAIEGHSGAPAESPASVTPAPKLCGALLRLSRVGYGTCDLPAGHTGFHHCDTR